MNYYIIFGYIFIILSVLLATIICFDSMYDSSIDIDTYYKLKGRTTGIVKSTECDKYNDCMYNIEYTINNKKKIDKFYVSYKPVIGEKVNILYKLTEPDVMTIEKKYNIIDLTIFYLLIIIIIILWFFIIIIIIFSNNFNKYLHISYVSFSSIFLLFIFSKYNYLKYKIELIKLIILLLILFILIFNYILIIFL